MITYPSKLLENAVNEFSRLPGIGRKSALRLALYLLKQEAKDVEIFGNTIIKLRNEIIYCRECRNLSDTEICSICANQKRDHSTVCIVENIRDVLAIENTGQFTGIYHVLGGIISPVDGIGPEDLTINYLIARLQTGVIKEIILALPTTIEGDTTNFYLYKKFMDYNLNITAIARGISIGDEIEYTDEVTLGRSIVNRTPYETLLPGR